MKPLNIQFNAAVLTMASLVLPKGFDVSAAAPSSYEAMRAHIQQTGRLCVSNVNSDQTIFADREVNYAFRAWHDWTHYTYKLPFTLEGEYAVSIQMLRDLAKVYGKQRAMEFWPFIDEEVNAQAEYLHVTDEFIVDQYQFAVAWLNRTYGSVI